MSKEKQIEEMAKALTKYEKGLCERLPKDKCLLTSAIHAQVSCDYCKIAEFLYNAGYRKIPDNIGDFSDGYHSFNELYHHRAVLFSVICNTYPEKAWKSKLHDTGDMYDGMFIVGIETEQGQATYHYDIEPYWDMFKVKELDKAPKWDGHTPSDAIERIGSLSCEGYRKQEWISVDERLPEEGKYVIVWVGSVQVAMIEKGISEEERQKMKNGEVEDRIEYGWSLSTGCMPLKRSNLYKSCDVFGNNLVPYCWKANGGPMEWFGQNVTHWMPLPTPPKEYKND